MPLTREQRRDKFFRCAERVLDRAGAERLAERLERIDDLPDVREVMDIARGSRE